jgi:hypothetical protein
MAAVRPPLPSYDHLSDRAAVNEETLYLLMSLAMLGVGPLMYRLLEERARARSFLNGFILISVGGLVAFFVLPQVAGVVGGWALVAAIAGLAGPIALERFAGVASRKTHLVTLGLALLGLTLHTAMDGMVLGGNHVSMHGAGLALAVALHRLPVGLTVWALVKPRFGVLGAVTVLAIIAAGTLGGYFAADAHLDVLHGAGFGLFQAFVAGSLLHVILHHPAAGHANEGRWKLGEALGGVAGAALVFALSETHQHAGAEPGGGLADVGTELLALSLESAPALLLGFTLAGVFAVFMPRASIDWIGRGNRVEQATRGMVFGLPIPICSCGVVPLYQSLVQRGVPAPAAMAFLIATPELEIGAIILTVPLLGGELTVARVAAAAFVALAVGALVGGTVARAAETTETEAPEDSQERTLGEKLREMVRFGFAEVVDDTAPWIVAGLVIAAVLSSGGIPDWTHQLPMGLDVVLFAILGMPFYVCASGATPLAAALVFAGVSPGAGIAFLISGPATNVTTFGVLSQLHGKRTAATFAVAVIMLSIAVGYAINLVWGASGLAGQAGGLDPHGSWIQWVSLAGIALLFLVSLVRLGPTEWLNTVLSFGMSVDDDCCDDDCGSGGHDHAHRHDHAHDHDAAESNESSCCSSSGCH